MNTELMRHLIILLLSGVLSPSLFAQVTVDQSYMVQYTGDGKSYTTNDFANGYRRFSVREGERMSINITGLIQSTGQIHPYVTMNGLRSRIDQEGGGGFFYTLMGPADVEFTWFDQDNINFRDLQRGKIVGLVQVMTTLSPYSADKSVIIPAGSKGGVIALDMSTDLVTWTPTTPGTFASTTTNMFFRIRLDRLDN